METQRNKPCPPKCRLLVEVLVVILWSGALVAVNYLVKPRRQGFFCNDDTIKYPHKEDTVSAGVIISVTLALPALVILFTEACNRLYPAKPQGGNPSARGQPGAWSFVGAYMIYFFGYLVLNMLVVVLKVTTGQLRPHFFAVCKPDYDQSQCTGYVSDYNCTNTEMGEKLIDSSRKSFPSGHAGYAVYMSLFLILYLDLRLQVRQHYLLRLTLYAVLTLYALWCSYSRVSDHQHHVTDVLAGGVLGGLVAVVTFSRGTLLCLRTETPQQHLDVETGRHTTANDSNVNCNNNNDDEDDNMETETPSTPTPLLFNGVSGSSLSGSRLGSFKLEGNKHNFRKFSLR